MKLILLGGPGSGKGTQAELLSKALSIPSISTGDIFRKAIDSGTEVGKVVGEYINAGKLVPDEIVLETVYQRLACEDTANGYILDGFPRTTIQAEAFDTFDECDYVVSLEVPDEVIEKRLTGRRVCSGCGKTYHILYDEAAVVGICEVCGKELVTRKDDNPTTVRQRLEIYHKQAQPLKDHYRKKGKLREIDGSGDAKTIRDLILKELGAEI
jgi:adenylate kinase